MSAFQARGQRCQAIIRIERADGAMSGHQCPDRLHTDHYAWPDGRIAVLCDWCAEHFDPRPSRGDEPPTDHTASGEQFAFF